MSPHTQRTKFCLLFTFKADFDAAKYVSAFSFYEKIPEKTVLKFKNLTSSYRRVTK